MKKVAIGNTGLKVNKNGFGALPIQRVPMKEAVYLLRKAYDNGIDFYDTARFYIGIILPDRTCCIYLDLVDVDTVLL